MKGIVLVPIPLALAWLTMFAGFRLMLATPDEPLLSPSLRRWAALVVATGWTLGLAAIAGKWEGRWGETGEDGKSDDAGGVTRVSAEWRTFWRAVGVLAGATIAAGLLWDWANEELADIRRQAPMWASIAATGGIPFAATRSALALGWWSRWLLRACWSIVWVMTCFGVATGLDSERFREGIAGALVVYGLTFMFRTFDEEAMPERTPEAPSTVSESHGGIDKPDWLSTALLASAVVSLVVESLRRVMGRRSDQ